MGILHAAALWVGLASAGFAAPNLVLAIGGEPETGFDPMLGWGSYGNPLFQSTLLRRDADLQTQPDLATSWVLSQDRRVWTVTLREGVRFSDGTPLTAKDVAFTFNTAKGAAGPVDLAVMQQAEATGPLTVRFTLDRPWITFTEAFHTLGIVPGDTYGPGYGRAPLGSGPYRLQSWTEGEQLIVATNPYYYGNAPDFPQITFLFTGADSALTAAHAGAVQMVAVPAEQADVAVRGFHRVSVRSVDNRGLSLPLEGVTADIAIRRAINVGLDRDLLVDVVLNGHGTPAFGPADTLPWAGPEDTVAFDLDAARAVLDDAGWLARPDGIRAKDGVRAAFPINYPAGDPTRQALAETVAELLRPLGMDAVAKGGSWNVIDRVMRSQPVIFGFGSHSPYQLYSLFAQRLAGVEYMNVTHYSNPQVETLFEAAQNAESLAASAQFWSAAAAHYGVQGDNSWAWLVNLDHVYLVDDCLDLGKTQTEPHGHGWPITALLAEWRWTCE